MDTIHLLCAYALFFVVGIVVGALQHRKVLTVVGRFYAVMKTWFMTND